MTSAAKLYPFVLQQMAAESLLDRQDLTLSDILRIGNTDTRRTKPEDPLGYTRLTNPQSEEFISDFEIAAHHANDSTGFSATLFRWEEDGQPRYTLSIRSTEYKDFDKGGDWARDGLGADLGIVASGFALAQLAALEDFFNESVLPIVDGQKIYVTGYSLGGHLAAVFTESHAAQIEHTYVFDAPGRGLITTGTTAEKLGTMLDFMRGQLIKPDDAPLSQLPADVAFQLRPIFNVAKAAYDADPLLDPFAETQLNGYRTVRYLWASAITKTLFPISPHPLPQAGLTSAGDSLITAIYGRAFDNDFNITANSQLHASSTEQVFIEGQPALIGTGIQALGGDFGDTHSITLIADSLALQREFQRLDSELTREQIERLIAASSAKRSVAHADGGNAEAAESDSLEKALLYLRISLDRNATEVPSSGLPGGFGDIANRELFYQELQKLPSDATHELVDLTDKVGPEITALAADDQGADIGVATRFALLNLQPFAVVGGDYGDGRFAEGEIDLYDAVTDRGMTEQWLRGRADFLDKLIDFNVANGGVSGFSIGGFFEDAERDLVIGSSTFLGRSVHYFAAKEGTESYSGSSGSDSLFGSVGADHFQGAAGDDYLEGGFGADTLHGGDDSDELHGGADADELYGDAGQDRLFGETGNDRLEGGEGSDALEGGSGFDTYIYADGDGRDEIFDGDGSGRILYKGRILEGGQAVDGSTYEDVDGTRYTLVSGPEGSQGLLIDDTILVRDFHSGDLGITLSGESDDPAPSPGTPVHTYATSDWLPEDQVERFADGVVDPIFPLASVFHGSDQDDLVAASQGKFWTRGGRDTVLITSGQISVDTGVDDDYIDASASAQASAIAGGSGDDYILGGAASETIFGDNQFASLSVSSSEVTRQVDGFGFDLSSSRLRFPLPFPDDERTIRAGWGALVSYYDYLRFVEAPRQTFEFSEMQVDIQSAGWDFGDLPSFLKYVVGAQATFDDRIDAGGGDDKVVAGSGSDTVYGGNGNDSLYGDYGSATAPGFNISYSGLQTLFGAQASLFGKPGDDYLDGGAGADTIVEVDGGNDVLVGGEGDDFLLSSESAQFNDATAYNRIDGGAGNDTIFALGGAGQFNILDGGDGSDRISFGGNAVVDGGDGDDTYNYGNRLIQDLAYISDGGGNDVLFLGSSSLEIAGDLALPPEADAEAIANFADAAWAYEDQDVADAVRVAREGRDLVFSTTGPQSRLVFRDWFLGPAHKIEQVSLLFEGVEPVPLAAGSFERWGSLQRGTSASESFLGEANADRILAGGGDDFATGAAGDDLIVGGEGDDVLDGGAGDDRYFYSAGHGNDVVIDAAGSDELWLGPGIALDDISLSNGPNAVTLHVSGGTIEIGKTDSALPAVERLVFADGSSAELSGLLAGAPVDGSAEADAVTGGTSDDAISGGEGDDFLRGLGGSDTYSFSLGDGIDRIDDLPAEGETNSIRFGPGITPDMLTLGTGSLTIRVGSGGDEIHLQNVDPGDIMGAHDVERFLFDDGTEMSYAELLARGLDVTGSSFDDVLLGSSIGDRVSGGRGHDVLIGGRGPDEYFYDRGDGADWIIDQAEDGAENSLRFGAGISQASTAVARLGEDLVITTADGDSIELPAWFASPQSVSRFLFADGNAWTSADVLAIAGDSPPPEDDGGCSSPMQEQQSARAIVPLELAAPISQDEKAGPPLPAASAAAIPFPSDLDPASAPGSAGPAEVEPSPQEAEYVRPRLLQQRDVEEALSSFRDAGRIPSEDSVPRLAVSQVRAPGHETDGRFLDRWTVAEALLQLHLSRPDPEGWMDRIAFSYGTSGMFAGLSLQAAQERIGAASFGSEAHSLRQFSGLSEGFASLG